MRFEILCTLPDHTAKDKDATRWVTVDWAHTEKEAGERRKMWLKRGSVRINDLEMPKKARENRRHRRDEDDDDDFYGY